jgi:hypothetical protein
METTSSHKEAATMFNTTYSINPNRNDFIVEAINDAQAVADKTGNTLVVAEDKATGYIGVTSIDNVVTNSNGNQYDLRIIAKVEPTEGK